MSKYLGDNFFSGVRRSVNKIEKYVRLDPSRTAHYGSGMVVFNSGDLMYYDNDCALKYSLMSLFNSKVVEPRFQVGCSYIFFGDSTYGTVNTAAVLTF